MATATRTAPNHDFQQETPANETKLEDQTPMDPGDVSVQSRSQDIAQLAYSYWEARGCRDGSAEEDWLRAERALYGDAG